MQEEVSRIINYNVEQECNSFLRAKVILTFIIDLTKLTLFFLDIRLAVTLSKSNNTHTKICSR